MKKKEQGLFTIDGDFGFSVLSNELGKLVREGHYIRQIIEDPEKRGYVVLYDIRKKKKATTNENQTPNKI